MCSYLHMVAFEELKKIIVLYRVRNTCTCPCMYTYSYNYDGSMMNNMYSLHDI